MLQAAVWLSGHYHVGLGRLDQYLWPWLDDDLATGRLDVPAAEELLADGRGVIVPFALVPNAPTIHTSSLVCSS